MPALRLPEDRPWIIGHRGARGDAPDNTLESIQEAIDQKADMVELDLWFTKDKQFAVLHGPLIRYEKQWTPVPRLTVEQLKACPVRKWRAKKLYDIPTLAEVFEAAPDLPLNLDLKYARDPRADEAGGPTRDEEVAAIADALAAAIGDRQQLLISSFQRSVLRALHERLPEMPLALIVTGWSERWVEFAEEFEVFSIHVDRATAKDTLGKQLDAERRPVVVYTVDDTAEARRLVKKGAAGIITNRPGRLRDRLGD